MKPFWHQPPLSLFFLCTARPCVSTSHNENNWCDRHCSSLPQPHLSVLLAWLPSRGWPDAQWQKRASTSACSLIPHGPGRGLERAGSPGQWGCVARGGAAGQFLKSLVFLLLVLFPSSSTLLLRGLSPCGPKQGWEAGGRAPHVEPWDWGHWWLWWSKRSGEPASLCCLSFFASFLDSLFY